jgi:hypothetical protein
MSKMLSVYGIIAFLHTTCVSIPGKKLSSDNEDALLSAYFCLLPAAKCRSKACINQYIGT